MAKIWHRGQKFVGSDFDENDTKELEKFKELNGGIFSIWFFVSNELWAISYLIGIKIWNYIWFHGKNQLSNNILILIFKI